MPRDSLHGAVDFSLPRRLRRPLGAGFMPYVPLADAPEYPVRSTSLPALLPSVGMVRREPSARVEAAAGDGDVPRLPVIAAAGRRMPTRERIWRERLKAAEDGLGPDPLSIHCLRKHAYRFKPGGLASQMRMPAEGFSACAVANARICVLSNGFPAVRSLGSIDRIPPPMQ